MDSLFLAACRGQATPRPPLWLMRQAGRYLPEYREIRKHVSFLELCKTPALAAEVTLQPVRRFGFDAAILFSDLLVPLEAMGLEVLFTERDRRCPTPCVARRIWQRLRVFDPWESTPFVCEAIRLLGRQARRHAAHRFRRRAVHHGDLRHRGQDRQALRADQEALLSEPETAHRLLARSAGDARLPARPGRGRRARPSRSSIRGSA